MRDALNAFLDWSGLSGCPQITLPFGGAPFDTSPLARPDSNMALIRPAKIIFKATWKA